MFVNGADFLSLTTGQRALKSSRPDDLRESPKVRRLVEAGRIPVERAAFASNGAFKNSPFHGHSLGCRSGYNEALRMAQGNVTGGHGANLNTTTGVGRFGERVH